MSLTGMTDREEVHRRVCSLRGQRGELDYEQGRWLLAAQRLGIHASLGLGSFAEYAERYGGIDARQARERLRVAEALESLPELAAALKTGELTWSAARELTRVVIEEKQTEWLEAARGRTAREIERMVASREKGDGPLDPAKAEPPRRLVHTVSAPTWALLKEAREAMTAQAGASIDDDAFLAELARTYLARGAAKSAGAEDQPAYSIAITVCDTCKTATQRAGADQVVISETALEQARCDAEELGRVDVAKPAKITRAIPPKIRRAVVRRHNGCCAVPGCGRSVFVQIHHGEPVADGGTHDPEKLVLLCDTHHGAAHVGTLVIRGTWSTGFVFEHADGTRYGTQHASPALSSVLAKVHEALVGMGFKMREAQAMVDRAKPHVGREPTVDRALRAALREAALPRGMSGVRESRAAYVRVAVYANQPARDGGAHVSRAGTKWVPALSPGRHDSARWQRGGRSGRSSGATS